MRGYFGIGIMNGKTIENLGTLWRSANLFEAQFIFTIGKRYKKQASDTMKSHRHIPLYHYESFEDFYKNIPYDCQLIGIELDEKSKPIKNFCHPERCVYLLGAEDNGLTKEVLQKCTHIIQLPGRNSMNVAVAGSIVMYDRNMKND
jgi:tRNA G18 (ribose-2'-O)-methylase SpoU